MSGEEKAEFQKAIEKAAAATAEAAAKKHTRSSGWHFALQIATLLSCIVLILGGIFGVLAWGRPYVNMPFTQDADRASVTKEIKKQEEHFTLLEEHVKQHDYDIKMILTNQASMIADVASTKKQVDKTAESVEHVRDLLDAAAVNRRQ